MAHYAQQLRFGEIHFKHDADTGLFALIAIHNTNLGPSLGGCRYKEYHSVNDALWDVMRLAKGMSYKSAIAGMKLGGGKAVILKTPQQTQREKLFECFGEFVDSFNGRYITAVDSGTKSEDMDIIARKTSFVSSYSGKDPSPSTAKGVIQGMLASVKYHWQRDSLENLTIAIQGVGNVGYYLAKELSERGARVLISDVSQQALNVCRQEFDPEVIAPEDILKVECDILAPCAFGAVFNSQTIPDLNCKMIVGAANNQLSEEKNGEELQRKGIIYAPDYVVNAGGVIHAGAQYYQLPNEEIEEKISNIYETVLEIFERAARLQLPTYSIADQIAEERMNSVSSS